MSTSGDLDVLLNRLFNIVVRYRGDIDTFYRRLNRTEYRRPLPEKTLLIREKEFEEIGDKYKDMIDEVVGAAMKEVKENTPVNLIKKTANKLKAKPKVEDKKPNPVNNKKDLPIKDIVIEYRPIKILSL